MVQSRLPVVVRDATPQDADELLSLWEMRAAEPEGYAPESAKPSTSPQAPSTEEAALALATIEADPKRRVLIAAIGDELVGTIAIELRPVTALHTTDALVVDDVHVRPQYRRRWVASSLMSAAVRWAEDAGCDLAFSCAPAASRDAHRFLTRLGFSTQATMRAAQISGLRSRFGQMATSSKDTGKLIAIRRTLRRRHSAAAYTASR